MGDPIRYSKVQKKELELKKKLSVRYSLSVAEDSVMEERHMGDSPGHFCSLVNNNKNKSLASQASTVPALDGVCVG